MNDSTRGSQVLEIIDAANCKYGKGEGVPEELLSVLVKIYKAYERIEPLYDQLIAAAKKTGFKTGR